VASKEFALIVVSATTRVPQPAFVPILVALQGRLRFLPATSVKGRILVRAIPIFIALLVVFFHRQTREMNPQMPRVSNSDASAAKSVNPKPMP
jgi:hypothetical protein